MTIATCPRCSNTGAGGERYCDCPAAVALRARIDADPRILELRSRIERNLGRPGSILVKLPGGGAVLHEPAGWIREVPVPSNAPPDVRERIQAYNAVAGQLPTYACARCHAPMHALQGCFPAHEGNVCHACHTRPPEPRYLTLGPRDNPEVN